MCTYCRGHRRWRDLDLNGTIRLQHLTGLSADGVAGPRTWAVLGKKLGYSIYSMRSLDAVPVWARNLLLNNPAATILSALNVDTALTLFEKICAPLSASQRAGLSFLLQKLNADSAIADVRWAADVMSPSC